MKTIEYTILQTKTRKGMKEKVTEFINEGYECQGGIAKDGEMYMQAVILRREE